MRTVCNLSILIFCLLPALLSAQIASYKRIDTIPVFQNGIQLKNPWAGGFNYPLFSEIDLNGDGIKDLFVFDRSNGRIATGRIECFLNNGTPDSIDYKFSSSYFNSFPYLHDWVFLRDYNCDDKEDIFAFSDDYQGIKVYENISSGNNLQFTLVTPLLTMMQNSQVVTIPSYPSIYPAIIDVDNDGDLDILNLTKSQPRTVVYSKNMSEENGWGCDSLAFEYETSCWGNFSFAIGPNEVCDTCWKCPDGVHDGIYHFGYNPADAARQDDSFTNIFAFDENGDGAKDLLIGDLASANSLLILNGGTPAAANMISQDLTFPSYNTIINLPSFTNHAYIDVNNDGKKDLLVSCTYDSDNNSVLFYKNDSITASPKFSYQSTSFLQDQMIDVGEGCYPVFFDYDGDGLMDLVIGNNLYNPQLNGVGTALSLYKNIGTSTSPAFELITTDFANISELGGLNGPIYPAFGDMDGDGKEDLILGNEAGTLLYFKNTALGNQPANFQFEDVDYFGIQVGQSSTPQLIDLNHDGVLDLVIGNQNGYLKYYQNTGTKYAANFSSTPTIDSLGKANTYYGPSFEGFSVPFIYKDSAGNFEMFLAGLQGYVFHYTNVDTNPNSVFTLADTMINLSEGQQLSVSGADINNDGKIELIVGNYAGGAGIFSTNLPLSVQNFTEIKPSFELFPNPSDNLLNVRLYNLNEPDARINIIDMLGRNVNVAKVNSSSMSIDISYLPDGIYLAELLSAKFRVSQKLIIEHSRR